MLGRSRPLQPRYAHFGRYTDQHGKVIDDCVLPLFEHGKSFTGEAMLEIAPHGNPPLYRP